MGRSQGRLPGGGASTAEFTYSQQRGVFLWDAENPLNRRNWWGTTWIQRIIGHFRLLSVKFEPPSTFTSGILYFNYWTRMNRANHSNWKEWHKSFPDHLKSKIQILHTNLTNYHQLETKCPQNIIFISYSDICSSFFWFWTLSWRWRAKNLWVWLD